MLSREAMDNILQDAEIVFLEGLLLILHLLMYKTLFMLNEAQWTVTWKSSLFPTGKVSLQADNGRYLARCYECIELSGKVGALAVKDDSINPASTWSAIKIGGKVAFQSDNGRYISRCLNCFNNSTIPNSAVIISRTPSITTAKLYKLTTEFS